jgi:hypothetical protein
MSPKYPFRVLRDEKDFEGVALHLRSGIDFVTRQVTVVCYFPLSGVFSAGWAVRRGHWIQFGNDLVQSVICKWAGNSQRRKRIVLVGGLGRAL